MGLCLGLCLGYLSFIDYLSPAELAITLQLQEEEKQIQASKVTISKLQREEAERAKQVQSDEALALRVCKEEEMSVAMNNDQHALLAAALADGDGMHMLFDG